jgi:hypothetical protein
MLEFHVDDTAADDKEDTLVEMAFHVRGLCGWGAMGRGLSAGGAEGGATQEGARRSADTEMFFFCGRRAAHTRRPRPRSAGAARLQGLGAPRARGGRRGRRHAAARARLQGAAAAAGRLAGRVVAQAVRWPSAAGWLQQPTAAAREIRSSGLQVSTTPPFHRPSPPFIAPAPPPPRPGPPRVAARPHRRGRRDERRRRGHLLRRRGARATRPLRGRDARGVPQDVRPGGLFDWGAQGHGLSGGGKCRVVQMRPISQLRQLELAPYGHPDPSAPHPTPLPNPPDPGLQDPLHLHRAPLPAAQERDTPHARRHLPRPAHPQGPDLLQPPAVPGAGAGRARPGCVRALQGFGSGVPACPAGQPRPRFNPSPSLTPPATPLPLHRNPPSVPQRRGDHRGVVHLRRAAGGAQREGGGLAVACWSWWGRRGEALRRLHRRLRRGGRRISRRLPPTPPPPRAPSCRARCRAPCRRFSPRWGGLGPAARGRGRSEQGARRPGPAPPDALRVAAKPACPRPGFSLLPALPPFSPKPHQVLKGLSGAKLTRAGAYRNAAGDAPAVRCSFKADDG